MVAATIRTIFAQTTREQVRTQLDVVADMLGRQFPQVKAMLLDAATDITAFADFPPAHWKKIWSTDVIVKEGGSRASAGDGGQAGPADRARGLPLGRQQSVGVFGLFSDLAFVAAQLLVVVVVARPAAGDPAFGVGGQLELAAFEGNQARAGESVVLLLGDQVPGDDGDLPGDRDDRDLHPAPAAIRWWRARSGHLVPGCRTIAEYTSWPSTSKRSAFRSRGRISRSAQRPWPGGRR
ncbi:hypothetical protein QF027_009879 [Streptomyces canus]|nr:hypothetical protein [Streptomyces canus]